MSPNSQDLLEFGEFRLDVAERRLLRNGEIVPLAPKLFDLLVVLAQNPGKLMDKDLLLERLWPGTHVEESNLSVNVSALRRALGDGAAFIETVPKRGYRFAGSVQVPAAEPVPVVHRAIPKVWTVAGICFSIAAVAILLFLLLRSRDVSDLKSLAVFPFTTLAADDSQAYLGLGMADAIITRLSRPNRIDVRPTSAVLSYAGGAQDLTKGAKDLQVDASVEGHIQLLNDRVRVTVQLRRVRDGKQIWADAFDDYFSNVFAVQDEIAERIAKALAIKLTDAEHTTMLHRSTENTEAYRLFLQGQYLASKRLNEATLSAIDYYQQAIAKDPTYAPPYAAIAHSYMIRAGEGLADDLREKARTAALKALSLDNKLPDAYTALGQVLMRSEWDWAGAERAFRQAIALDANSASAHAALATIHTALGHHADAIHEMEIACRVDPMSASLRSDLSWTLLLSRKYPEATREAKRAVELDAWSYSAHRQLSKAYLMTSQFNQAVEEAKRTLEINAGRRRRVLAELAAAEAAAGQRAQALEKRKDLEHGKWTEPPAYFEMAVLNAWLGDRDAAIAALSAAVDHRISRVIWINADPELDSLRADPRFQALVKKLGL